MMVILVFNGLTGSQFSRRKFMLLKKTIIIIITQKFTSNPNTICADAPLVSVVRNAWWIRIESNVPRTESKPMKAKNKAIMLGIIAEISLLFTWNCYNVVLMYSFLRLILIWFKPYSWYQDIEWYLNRTLNTKIFEK